MRGRAGLLAALGVILAAGAGALLWLGGEPAPGPAALEVGPALEPGGERAAVALPPREERARPPKPSAQRETSERVAAPSGACYLSLSAFFVGQAAPGAEVRAADVQAATTNLGATDGAGALLAALEPGTWTVTVAYPGAARWTRTLVLVAGETRDLTVQLGRSAPIAGMVQGSEGQPVGEGTHVWAWDAELPDIQAILAQSRGATRDARLLHTTTLAGGHFRLEGPERGRAYRLAAWGPAGLNDQGLVVAGGSQADVKLRAAFARVISFRTPAGQPLMDPALALPGAEPLAESSSRSKRFSLTTNPELWLTPAGAVLSKLPRNSGPLGPQVVGYFPPVAEAQRQIWSASVTLRHPDFQTQKARLELPRLEGEVPWTEFVVEPKAGRKFGRLVVDARLSAAVQAGLRGDSRSLGVLHLTHESGRMQTLALAALGGMPMGAVELPAGSWTGRAVTRDQGFGDSADAHEVAVQFALAGGEEHRLRLDLTRWGAARVHLGEGAEAWAGGAILSVEGAGSVRRFLMLPHGPYVVLGLGPGAYRVEVHRLLGSPLTGAAEGGLGGAGELLELELPLSKGPPR